MTVARIADKVPPMHTGSTWLREVPGWLFVAAGLTLCVVGVLVPAQRSVHVLHRQLARIENQHALGQTRIEAYERFLDRLRHRDPSLVRRLAAAELNLVPAGATPVLLSSTQRATVHDWIVRSADITTPRAGAVNESRLSWLTDGSRRLWVLGFGVLVVFVGLVVDSRPRAATRRCTSPGHSRPRRRPDQFHVNAGVEWSGNGQNDDEIEEDDDELDDEADSDEFEDDDEDDDEFEDDDDEFEEEEEDDQLEEDDDEAGESREDDEEEGEDEEDANQRREDTGEKARPAGSTLI